MFYKKTYSERRAQLRKDIEKGLIVFPANNEAAANYAGNPYPFRQDSNFLYFFGLKTPGMAGVIDVDSDTDWLYADDLTMDDIIWMGHLPKVEQQAESTGITRTGSIGDLQELLHKAALSKRKVHFVNPYRSEIAAKLASWLSVPVGKIVEMQSVELIKAIVKQRSIKSSEEIEEIENAMIIAHQMHGAAMRMAKQGVYEYQIAGALQGIAASHNGSMSFTPIVSIHGETLHNHHYGEQLCEGRMLVVDAGAETYNHYCSDITRTTPVGGKFSKKQKEIYEIVLKANMATIETVKPGVPYRDYHLNACKIIFDGLKDLGLTKGDTEEAVRSGAHALFMPHGLGHFMGLDVHDMENMGENLFGYDDEIKRSSQFGLAYLRLGRRLAQGFVLTDEPGIYFIPALIDLWESQSKFSQFINYDKIENYRDFGGIRIEDDLLITKDGAQVLGPRIPKTVEEIEAWCSVEK
ncbi:MAG: aminopeptidase P family protein [Bacteroidales bacterium]|jgi:Xaa-Pro aminopeptidase|nr:aminopeptidase P family protein [Bacteroidales bacterium]